MNTFTWEDRSKAGVFHLQYGDIAVLQWLERTYEVYIIDPEGMYTLYADFESWPEAKTFVEKHFGEALDEH